jgi:hypothetical protein
MTTNAIGRALTGHLLPPRQPGLREAIEPALVDAKAGARLLSVSPRKFHELRPLLPAPVVLSARVVRWKTADLRRYVEGLAGAEARPEPSQLAAARVKRRVADVCGADAADFAGSPRKPKTPRAVGKRAVQSNSEVDTVNLPLPGIEG